MSPRALDGPQANRLERENQTATEEAEGKGRKRRRTDAKAVSRKIEDFSVNFTHHEAAAAHRPMPLRAV